MCVFCASCKELQSPFRLWGEEKLSVKSTGILLAIILVQSGTDFDQRVNNSYLNFTPNQKIDSFALGMLASHLDNGLKCILWIIDIYPGFQ